MALRVVAGWNPSLQFDDPVMEWAPHGLDEALDALERAERALRDGYWLAGAFTYDFGARLHGIASGASRLPLLVLGAFRAPRRSAACESVTSFKLSAPLARETFGEYERRIAYLLGRIRDGEVYQVNYTVPFNLGFEGDPYALHRFLAERSGAAYSAFLQFGDLAIASISPELFLRFDGDVVRTKPMKGTAAPGRRADLGNAKNRAEHVMIVDLLRNDLNRACSGVRVEKLFEIESYPTFETMTSTVAGDLPRDPSLSAIVRALFPCGSVTGAPKLAAMRHIAATEPDTRGFYTGSVGFLSPEWRGWWNVAIRTLQFCDGAARFDAGGGIVSDSDAADEWSEIGVKSEFLAPAYAGFALLETFRSASDASAVDAHLARLEAAAHTFGIASDGAALRAQLAAIGGADAPLLVRVRTSRAGTAVATEPLEEPAGPVGLCLSTRRLDSGDPFLRYKTSWRPVHDAALREARDRGCFDAILCNERGEIADGARSTIFAQIGNTLYTPVRASGALPGILRSVLVSEGRARERVLFPEDLKNARAIFAGNSARGLLRAELQP